MAPPARESEVARIGEEIYTIELRPLDKSDHALAVKKHFLVRHDSEERKNT